MPYSTACNTPLSNFEAGQNYKEVLDPAIVVSFPLDEDPQVSLVAWTTTPWTLPSNLAVCVHPELTYVQVSVGILQLQLVLNPGQKYVYLVVCIPSSPNMDNFCCLLTLLTLL